MEQSNNGTIQQWNNGIMKSALPKILIFVCAVLFAALTSLICYKLTYQRLTADIEKNEAKYLAEYASNISTKTDTYSLTKAGLRQLNSGIPDYALVSLKQATAAQNNYRDAWLGLGLAQFETGDPDNALISLKTAEALDPINPKTYQLLALTYTKKHNLDLAKIAEEKYKFLVKNEK